MNWNLKVYGVRGSHPLASPYYIKYGGNTSCFHLDCGSQMVFDAGTGIRQLGVDLLNRKMQLGTDPGPIHIFLSHMHLDHIQGLMAFAPLFQDGWEIHIYGENHGGRSVDCLLKQLLAPPFWPLSLESPSIRARIQYHQLEESKSFLIKPAAHNESQSGKIDNDGAANLEIEVTPIRLPHPDQCLGFLVRMGKQSFSYLLDCELDYEQQGKPQENTQENLLENLQCLESAELQSCSLAVMDGSYLPGQVIPGYGHSSWEECLAFAERKGIGTVLIGHYSDSLTDQVLDREQGKMLASKKEKALPSEQNEILKTEQKKEHCIFAREGMELVIDESGRVCF